VRVCATCGWENDDSDRADDSWCVKCRSFLGFPVGEKDRQRQIRLLLDDKQVAVRPGGEAAVTAQVHNRGDIVEQVIITLHGGVAGWSQPEPAEVGLFPDQKSEVRLVFRPPRSPDVRAGPTTFQVSATSRSDAQISDGAEGLLDVGVFVDVRASLSPMHSAGLAGADHRVVVDNAGNASADVAVEVSDPDDGLSFTIDPARLQIEPGAKGEARVRVSPRLPLAGANSKTHSFTVRAVAPGQTAIVFQAAFVQQVPAAVPALVLAGSQLHGVPGEEVTTEVTIRNRGGTEEGYSLAVLGPAAPWARVVPPTVLVPPGGEVVAKVVFSPRLAPPAPAGEFPFALRCVSQVDDRRAIVAEGHFAVDEVSDISFDVSPSETRARWSARYLVEIENQGNVTQQLRPVIDAPEQDLSFAVSPTDLTVGAGSRALVLVQARARRPRLLAADEKRPFRVSLISPAGRRGESSKIVGFEQLSVLPGKLVALLVVVALVAALVAVSLNPTVRKRECRVEDRLQADLSALPTCTAAGPPRTATLLSD
jgi:uncharacterized membrane protein